MGRKRGGDAKAGFRMNDGYSLENLVPTGQMTGEDEEETVQLRTMLADAKEYLMGFEWCHAITREFFGLGVGGVVGVFLFEIEAQPNVDNALWVIVGDLPSAYLVTDDADTPCSALRIYCDLMEEWILAIRSKKKLSEAFPVAAPPTSENANLLEKKVAFLRSEILPAFC